MINITYHINSNGLMHHTYNQTTVPRKDDYVFLTGWGRLKVSSVEWHPSVYGNDRPNVIVNLI